jgi:hypothetical protein
MSTVSNRAAGRCVATPGERLACTQGVAPRKPATHAASP